MLEVINLEPFQLFGFPQQRLEFSIPTAPASSQKSGCHAGNGIGKRCKCLTGNPLKYTSVTLARAGPERAGLEREIVVGALQHDAVAASLFGFI